MNTLLGPKKRGRCITDMRRYSTSLIDRNAISNNHDISLHNVNKG